MYFYTVIRTLKIVDFSDSEPLKKQLLTWGTLQDEVLWLDSNRFTKSNYSTYDAVLAVDAFTSIVTSYDTGFDKLEEYQKLTADWIFGYLSYDLKNDTERLKSQNEDHLGFPDLHFFQPKKLFLLKGNILEMHYLPMVDDEMDTDLKAIVNFEITNRSKKFTREPLSIKLKIHKEAFKKKISKMLSYIHRGDIYEANLCQEFYAHGTIDPLETYTRLNQISEPPFATFLKLDDRYLLSASPERYLKKVGDKIVSQPIKGTAPRDSVEDQDIILAKQLLNDPKERSENIMIVDLVRNDLSRTAKKGTVHVEELCGLYSFKQVHHMISTITSEIGVGISPVDVIRSTYPMGSMTGAPKVRAMQIIEELESTKRGLYSGTVGYFTPEGDFDFNVVIRSILYNAENQYISYAVGGAITANSDPDKEYAECLLKAKAMRAVLEGKS